MKRPLAGPKCPNDNRYCSYQCRWDAVRERDEYGRYLNAEGYIILRKGRRIPTQRRDVTDEGYVRVNLGRDERRASRNEGRMLEHRWVMEQTLGRKLHPDETVHHVNGVKTDNRPENLELWVGKHPRGQRVEDVVEWAAEMLQRYAPERLARREGEVVAPT